MQKGIAIGQRITDIIIKMKIAIPTFRERVSPRFDCANTLLTIEVSEDKKINEQKIVAFGEYSAEAKIKWLKENGIEILICGGIDIRSEHLLRSYGVKIYPWITGRVSDCVLAWLSGDMTSYTMIGRGGRSRGRWRFRWGRGPAFQ